VDLEPASIDLSTLSAGLGFRFAFRTRQAEEDSTKPILDKVTIEFE
jgi:hypothetical protein